MVLGSVRLEGEVEVAADNTITLDKNTDTTVLDASAPQSRLRI